MFTLYFIFVWIMVWMVTELFIVLRIRYCDGWRSVGLYFSTMEVKDIFQAMFLAPPFVVLLFVASLSWLALQLITGGRMF